MADVKISELPAATSMSSFDLVPIVQSGETKKASAGLFVIVSDNFNWNGQGLLIQDDSNLHNVFIGFQENPFGPISGQRNTGIGVDVMDVLTSGSGNTAVGFNSGSNYDTGSENTCIGDAAQSENNSSFVTAIGAAAIGAADSSTAVGENAIASGVGSTAIGTRAHALSDNSMVLGSVSLSDIYCGFKPSNSTVHANVHADMFTATTGFAGDGSQIIFPDSDPHINGAGYWSGGILTRSSG